jgi:hypothetical protein
MCVAGRCRQYVQSSDRALGRPRRSKVEKPNGEEVVATSEAPWVTLCPPSLVLVGGGGRMSYPVFMPKPSTHRMHDPGSIVPYILPKVFTDNQMSRIKYNFYINNVSKDCDNSQTKRNSRRDHNTIGMVTGVTRSLELLIEEFQSIFSF